jgi:hypothetical protein
MRAISTNTEFPRRRFLKMLAGAVAAVGYPAIVPASVMGQKSPSNRINIGAESASIMMMRRTACCPARSVFHT